MKDGEQVKYNLEDRLIEFAVMILKYSDMIPKNIAGVHLARQLVKSGTSPALNYGEALGSESRKDFIHKMRIALKELRETLICLKILKKSGITHYEKQLNQAINENNELISIFVRSVEIASKKVVKQR